MSNRTVVHVFVDVAVSIDVDQTDRTILFLKKNMRESDQGNMMTDGLMFKHQHGRSSNLVQY